MRMRKLDQGQTIVFCLPSEIESKIRAIGSAVDPAAILTWAVSGTSLDLRRSIPLWAMQGRRFIQQRARWDSLHSTHTASSWNELAEKFLEPESQTLAQMYQPIPESQSESVNLCGDDGVRVSLIAQRCAEFDCFHESMANLQEEQERELCPESEQERQVQKPQPAMPRSHAVHPDLRRFVMTGMLPSQSKAWQSAFATLRSTSAGQQFDVNQFPNSLLATLDFARTVQDPKSDDILDCFQRPVQWILTSDHGQDEKYTVEKLLIISPYEAQELMPGIEQSGKVTLHLYAARSSLQLHALDNLALYTIPSRHAAPLIHSRLKILLNLFAGQLYFQYVQEYTETCSFLGLACTKTEDDCVVAADGFVTSGQRNLSTGLFQQSPVPFLKTLMMKVRRNCETIDKTHIGRVLDGELLQPTDFP